jgi:bacterioferritin-associated ferredoxin
MYVCLCTGVTDREINETIAEGATSVEEVAYCTGAGTRCGSCVPDIARMLEGGTVEQDDKSGRRCLRVLTSAA